MSLVHPRHQPHKPDLDQALKALARLLARQAASEISSSNPKEKDADHAAKEDAEDAAKAGDQDGA